MSLVKRQKPSDSNGHHSFESHTFSLEGHEGTVLGAKFNKEGSVVATGGMDKKMLLWSLPHTPEQGLSPNFGEITGHKGAVTSLRWLDNGYLASSSADMTVGIWDTETGQRVRKFQAHTLIVNEIDQDDNLIASAADDGNVYIWEEKSKGFVNSFHTEYPLLTVAFHKNLIYTAGIEPIIRAWDIRSPSSPVFEIETLHTDTITSLAVDDSNLISRSEDGTVRMYEPRVVPGDHIRPNIYDGAPAGDENLTVRCVIRDNVIYSGAADKTVTVWDVTSRKLLRKLTGHAGTVIDVDEHEGKIVSTSVDGKAILRYTNSS